MKRLLLSLFRPLRLVAVEHPHGGIAVGGRTAFIVRAEGFGTLGRGGDARAVDGAFDGVVFVDVQGDHAVVEARGLLRRDRRRVPLTVVAVPPLPPPPRPALPPTPEVAAPAAALPRFDVSIEVP
jgi:hypothetical protein